jgi:hypothetical protein
LGLATSLKNETGPALGWTNEGAFELECIIVDIDVSRQNAGGQEGDSDNGRLGNKLARCADRQ